VIDTNPTNMSSLIVINVPSNNNVVPPPVAAMCCTRFSIDSCLIAVQNNHLKCLIRAHKTGCPLEKGVAKTAIKLKHTDCWTYAKSNVNTRL